MLVHSRRVWGRDYSHTSLHTYVHTCIDTQAGTHSNRCSPLHTFTQERRDELRLMYQEQLSLSHRREVQVKIMKQAHREAILTKDRTIQSLTDMMAENEEKIAYLEGRTTGQRFAVCVLH